MVLLVNLFSLTEAELFLIIRTYGLIWGCGCCTVYSNLFLQFHHGRFAL